MQSQGTHDLKVNFTLHKTESFFPANPDTGTARVFLALKFDEKRTEYFVHKAKAMCTLIDRDINMKMDQVQLPTFLSPRHRADKKLRFVDENRLVATLCAPVNLLKSDMTKFIDGITTVLNDDNLQTELVLASSDIKFRPRGTVPTIDSIFALPMSNMVLPAPNTRTAAELSKDLHAIHSLRASCCQNVIFSILRPKLSAYITRCGLEGVETKENADYMSPNGHLELVKGKSYEDGGINGEESEELIRYMMQNLEPSALLDITSDNWFVDIKSVNLMTSSGENDAKVYQTICSWHLA